MIIILDAQFMMDGNHIYYYSSIIITQDLAADGLFDSSSLLHR